MTTLATYIQQYLCSCANQKKLSPLTMKAYSIDLKQFLRFQHDSSGGLDRETISSYIAHLHEMYKPKSVKRKIACLKAFCSYLEYEEIIAINPFSRVKTKFQEPHMLPRTLSFENIQNILKAAYDSFSNGTLTTYQKVSTIRDIAVLELLFATGVRVSELCSLRVEDIDLSEKKIHIYGKGSKERIVQIENSDVLLALTKYRQACGIERKPCDCFFINRLGDRLSEQSVRFMIRKYTERAGVPTKVTPHMFRHTFATLLLEEDVDIRYIQQFLGHSSIQTTQIYTHVSQSKQKSILIAKHPRNRMSV